MTNKPELSPSFQAGPRGSALPPFRWRKLSPLPRELMVAITGAGVATITAPATVITDTRKLPITTTILGIAVPATKTGMEATLTEEGVGVVTAWVEAVAMVVDLTMALTEDLVTMESKVVNFHKMPFHSK